MTKTIRVVLPIAWLLMIFPAVAVGYEQTQTCTEGSGPFACDDDEEPRPLSWPVRCVRYRINEDGSEQFGGGETLPTKVHQQVVASFDAWNEPSCSDLTLVPGEPTANDTVGYNSEAGFEGNMNLVVWRDDDWPSRASQTAFALTSLTYSTKTGQLRDADIELNTANFDFSVSEDPDPNRVDLRNTLTHEVGHVIGLAHTPDRSATMYGTASAGETMKRTLAQDDVDGLCAIYPAGETRTQCSNLEDFRPPPPSSGADPDEPRGCSTSAARGATPNALAVLGLIVGFLALRWYGGRRRWNES